MGFFKKLKQNFTHGGVKVKLNAPASVSMNDASLPVTVEITASDSPQSIKGVRVEIVAQSMNQGFNEPSNGMSNNQQVADQVVARSDNNEGFTLQAGETKKVELSVVMNGGAALKDALPEGGAKQLAGALQKLQAASEALNQASYSYFIRAIADVDGIAIDPSHQQPIQIRKPGELGGGINLHT